jgi:hypothetical protein
MTLEESVVRLRSRFELDVDADIDVDSDEEMATAISDAAKDFTRRAFCLYTLQAALTLTDGEPEYSLLAPAVCALPVFHCLGVFVNGGWLEKVEPEDFALYWPGYASEASNAHPSLWLEIAPERIRIAAPPNATAVAASSYVRGFYEHPTLTRADDWDTELLGPEQFHRLIVDRAFVNNSKSYLAGSEEYRRRETTRLEYEDETGKLAKTNKARYKPSKRRGGAGCVRRFFGAGRTY